MEILKAVVDYIPTYDNIDFLDEGTELQIVEDNPKEEWALYHIEHLKEKRWFPKSYIEKKGEKFFLTKIFSPDELEAYIGELFIKIMEFGGWSYVMNGYNQKGWIPSNAFVVVAQR